VRSARKVSQGEGFVLSAKDQPCQAMYIEPAVYRPSLDEVLVAFEQRKPDEDRQLLLARVPGDGGPITLVTITLVTIESTRQ
ncbi:MAG: hypothetical protein ACC726_14660, partial [Chloroflexota bacterium]